MNMKQNMDLTFNAEDNTYATSDFYSAVVLRTMGFRLIDIDKSDKRRMRFVFENSNAGATAEQILQDYWDKVLQGDLRTFVDSINELKTRIYATD